MIRVPQASLRHVVAVVALLVSWLFASLPVFAQAADPSVQPVLQPSPTASAITPSRPKSSAPPAAPAPTVDDGHVASTPRRAFAAFVRAAEANDFAKASEQLDLRGLARGRLERDGPELAAMLYRVLSWRVALTADALPDEEAPAALGPDGVVLDVVDVDGQTYTLALAPVKQPSGQVRWQFSRATVAAIRPIYDANQRRVVEENVPDWLKRRPVFAGLFAWQWLGLVLLLGLAYLIGRVLGAPMTALLLKLVARLPRWVAEWVRAFSRPTRLAVGTATIEILSPYLQLIASFRGAIERWSTIFYIIAGAWAAIEVVSVATSTWERRLPDDTEGQMENRGLRTRLTMLRRIATVLIGIVAAGVVLLQFEVVRSIGVSLLASAGIAGVLVGIAAQRTLGGMIAGIEMSITQPLRIGDVVVFRPNEMGTVEHIFFTYVIVRLWDDRRLIVPVTRVMSEVFENWTRTDGSMLVSVELFADYGTPVEKLREAFLAECKKSSLWDRRVSRVHVVETTERAMRVRGVASIEQAARANDFRFELTEGWVRFLQELEGGAYLPVGRVESRDSALGPPAVRDGEATPAVPASRPSTRGGKSSS